MLHPFYTCKTIPQAFPSHAHPCQLIRHSINTNASQRSLGLTAFIPTRFSDKRVVLMPNPTKPTRTNHLRERGSQLCISVLWWMFQSPGEVQCYSPEVQREAVCTEQGPVQALTNLNHPGHGTEREKDNGVCALGDGRGDMGQEVREEPLR